MKRIILCLLVVCAVFCIAGCGKDPSEEPLNESEQLVYDALVEGSKDFNDPTSIKVMKCSDPFKANEYDKYVDRNNQYYYPYWDSSFEVVMIQISAATPSGGSSTEVYCMALGKDSKGRMGTFSDVLNLYNSKMETLYTTPL